MYRRRHQLAWHIWRPRGRRVTYNRIPSCTPPPTTTTVLSLPLTQMHREQASGL